MKQMLVDIEAKCWTALVTGGGNDEFGVRKGVLTGGNLVFDSPLFDAWAMANTNGRSNPIVRTASAVSVKAGDVLDYYAIGSTQTGFAYTITDAYQVETPVISPRSGSFVHSVTVSMSCSTANTTIRYTTDGTEPTSSSTLYTAPISIVSTTTINAKAFRASPAGSSATSTATFTKDTGGAKTWDLAGDWIANAAPSSGLGSEWAWSYGYDNLGGGDPLDPFAFQAYPNWNEPWIFFGTGGYGAGGTGDVPGIGKAFGTMPVDLPDGKVAFHTPESSGGTMPGIIRWTAPRAITVNFQGSVWRVDQFGDPGRDQLFGVRKNNEAAYFTGTTGATAENPEPVSATPYTFNVPGVQVQPGDVLDFFAYPDAGATGGFVAVDWTIAEVPGSELTPTPKILPNGGSFGYPQWITISCSEYPSATIRYTTDGSDPTTVTSGNAYTGAFRIAVGTTTIKARAFETGMSASDPASATFTIADHEAWDLANDWARNTIPPVGIGSEAVWSYGYDSDPAGPPMNYVFTAWPNFGGNVFGWNTDGGYYVDPTSPPQVGKKPTAGGWDGVDWPVGTIAGHTSNASQPMIFRWTSPRAIDVNVSAACWVAGYLPPNPLDLRWEYFGIRRNRASVAGLVPEDPFFVDLVDAVASPYANRVIRTLSAVRVEAGDTLDYVAYPGNGGGPVGAEYTVTEVTGSERTAAPVISPGTGTYFTPQEVTITCPQAGAVIRYTTDGSEPTTLSPIYVAGSPIHVAAPMLINAKAWSDGLNASDLRTATYVFGVDTPISALKSTVADDGSAACFGVVVTAKFGADTLYVEEPDRTSGIQVRLAGNTATVGRVVSVAGAMKTDATTGERYIEAVSLVDEGSTGSVTPVALNNKTLGGGPMGLQQGISDATGTNNIGLLVRIYGKALMSSTGDFYLDDGSGVGLRVVKPAGSSIPQDGDFVVVTGISSCESMGGSLSRLLKAVGEAQVVPVL